MLTGRQIRDARKLLGWRRHKLGLNAAVSLALLDAAESGDGPAWLTEDQEGAIRRTCEGAGVEFTPDGPRLRQEQKP